MQTKLTVFIALLFLAVGAAQSVDAQEAQIGRETSLANLKKCPAQLKNFKCLEKNVTVLMNVFNNGDKSVLPGIMGVGVVSDGYLAAGLGTFLAEVLQKNTSEFLSALSVRPKSEQRILAELASGADGGGNPESWVVDVKSKLKSIANSENKKLSPVAKLSLKSLEKFLARQNNR